MPFMKKQITDKVRWLRVETNYGIEFVSVYDTGFDWPNSEGLPEDTLQESLDELRDYCEGKPVSWENIQGYGARLSAPGYLDCTEWTVFDTPERAREYLKEMYGDEEEV